jgi:site-specific DNA-methyltransferase (adenine-specific)
MGGEKASLAWFDPPFGIDLVPQRGLTERIENDGNQQARALWAAFLPLLKENMSPGTNVFLCQDWTEFEWTLPLVRQYFTIKSKVVWNKNVWGIGYYTRPKHEDILYCWNGQPQKPVDPVADVWDVARESAPDHAAEKPPELSGIAISHFSAKGDVVVDWFNGVGGSVIACENLGRRCRAIELDAGFVATTLERWSVHTGRQPVLVDI